MNDEATFHSSEVTLGSKECRGQKSQINTSGTGRRTADISIKKRDDELSYQPEVLTTGKVG